MTCVDGIKYGLKVWQGQTKKPNVDSAVFALKMVGWSALAVWAIRKGPLSSRQIMPIPIVPVLVTLGIRSRFRRAEFLIEKSGLWIEPTLSTLLVTGGYGLYRAGGSLLPSCVRSFRWTTLLDLSYHSVLGAPSAVLGVVLTSGAWNEIRERNGIRFAS